MKAIFHRLRSSRDARRTGLISIAELLRLALQAVFFFLLAGILGVEGIGQYAGTAALIGVIQPLASWGSTDLLLKNVSRDHSLIHQWLGTSTTVTLLVSLILSGVIISVAPFILGSVLEWKILLPLLVSELITLRIVELAWASFLAMEKYRIAALIRLIWAAARFLTLVAFAFIISDPSPSQWAITQSIAMAALSIGIILLIWIQIGRADFKQPLKRMSFSEGFAFAAGSTSETIYGDADKTLLVRMRGEAVAGAYTVAYRLVSFAFVPISALVMSKLTAMFRAGHTSVRESLDLIQQFKLVLFFYTALIAAGLVLIGPVIPMVLGEEFAEAGTVLAWLALMPAVQAAHRVLGAVLMTTGHVKVRGIAQALTAIINVILSVTLIAFYSWKGAVIATYISEILLALMFTYWIRRQLKIAH